MQSFADIIAKGDISTNPLPPPTTAPVAARSPAKTHHRYCHQRRPHVYCLPTTAADHPCRGCPSTCPPSSPPPSPLQPVHLTVIATGNVSIIREFDNPRVRRRLPTTTDHRRCRPLPTHRRQHLRGRSHPQQEYNCRTRQSECRLPPPPPPSLTTSSPSTHCPQLQRPPAQLLNTISATRPRQTLSSPTTAIAVHSLPSTAVAHHRITGYPQPPRPTDHQPPPLRLPAIDHHNRRQKSHLRSAA